MNFEILTALGVGGLLTTIATRILPSKDKKLDFVLEMQNQIISSMDNSTQRISELEKHLEEKDQKIFGLLEEVYRERNEKTEITGKIRVLEVQVENLKNKLSQYENGQNTKH